MTSVKFFCTTCPSEPFLAFRKDAGTGQNSFSFQPPIENLGSFQMTHDNFCTTQIRIYLLPYSLFIAPNRS